VVENMVSLKKRIQQEMSLVGGCVQDGFGGRGVRKL
jgi:hypothetical protein